MAAIQIVFDADGKFPELEGKLRRADISHITSLARGTSGGNPSVAVLIPLEDGTVIFAETTLKLLLTACDAFVARHGDPRKFS